jgi:3-hydroxyacyl-CoA dehydrogenase
VIILVILAALYIALLVTIARGVQPLDYQNPVDSKLGNFDMLYFSKSEEGGLLQLIHDHLEDMNLTRKLNDAKAKALALVAAGYQPPAEQEISLPGPAGAAALAMAVDGFRQSGAASPHDAVVAKRLATVVTGGDTDPIDTVSEDRLSRLEREAFLDLISIRRRSRIERMLGRVNL